jgi:small subunit ribosomal protein S15
MALTAEQKAEIVSEYALAEGDTGSPEVQVALLTGNINQLQDHFKARARPSLPSRPHPHGKHPQETA